MKSFRIFETVTFVFSPFFFRRFSNSDKTVFSRPRGLVKLSLSEPGEKAPCVFRSFADANRPCQAAYESRRFLGGGRVGGSVRREGSSRARICYAPHREMAIFSDTTT